MDDGGKWQSSRKESTRTTYVNSKDENARVAIASAILGVVVINGIHQSQGILKLKSFARNGTS